MITKDDCEYLKQLPYLGDKVGLLDMVKKWYTSEESTIQVAKILNAEGVFETKAQVIDYFESPYNWEWQIEMLIHTYNEQRKLCPAGETINE